jgi:hypothetical protein
MYGLKPVPFKLKPVPFKGGDTQDYFNKLLEQFSNCCTPKAWRNRAESSEKPGDRRTIRVNR